MFQKTNIENENEFLLPLQLQQDDQFGVRMAAVSEVLLMNCDFTSMTKHAISFCRNLFNANFRSIYVWKKEDISNRKDNMTYEVVQSLPAEVRTWIGQERATSVSSGSRSPPAKQGRRP